MNYPVKAPFRPEEIESNLLLIPSGGKSPNKKRVVILRDAGKWGMKGKENKIILYKKWTLDRVPPTEIDSKRRNEIDGQRLDDEDDSVEMIEEKDFFIEKLALVKREKNKSFPGILDIKLKSSESKFNKQTVTPLIPLNKEILDTLDSNYIAENLKFFFGNSTVTVEL